MNRTEKCFICGRRTEKSLDVCPDCFSRLPDSCKEKYTKLTQEEKRLMITSPLWQMRINANEPHKSYGNKLSLYPDKGVLFFSGNYISLENIDNIEFQVTVNSATEALEGDGRGFEKTYSNFKIILTSLVSIILFSIILAYFNIILVIVCFLSTLLSIVIYKKVADYNRKRQKDLAHASRQKNYYNNTASDFSYGKDTRIFSLKEFIMDKYNDKSLSYLKVLHDLYNKEFKYGLFGLITLLLQDGISYSIIVYSAIQGYITLSEVTLYISSIVAFTTVLRTLSDNITDLIKNLKLTMTYFEFLDSTEKEKKLNKWEFDYHEGVTIEFQNVWFKYPNTDSYIFENLKINAKVNGFNENAIQNVNI